MKKRFTLLILIAALGCAGGGKVWGQNNYPTLGTEAHPNGTNVFSAADSKTLPAGTTQTGGTWITFGGENCVIHATNQSASFTQDAYYHPPVTGTYTGNCTPTGGGYNTGTLTWRIPDVPNTSGNIIPGRIYSKSSIVASDYTTPVTVILEGGISKHAYNRFEFKKVTWGGELYTYTSSSNTSIGYATETVTLTCIYYIGATPYTETQYVYNQPIYHRQWNYTQTSPGGFELDAAIKLLAGARVQLESSIILGTNADTPTKKHVVVFPSSGGYTLRMDGNFGNVDVAQEATTNVFYTQSNIPGNNTGSISVNDTDTLGVGGDYNNTDTQFETNGAGGAIQIGGATDNTNKFTINSGGTLMNYGDNNIHIGSLSTLPVLNINGGTAACHDYPSLITSVTGADMPLKISNTSQSIIFQNTTTPAPNLSGVSAGGALWITAHVNVNFNQGFTANFSTYNNYIQVQAGNDITTSTKPFSYTGGNRNYNFIATRDFTVGTVAATITTNDDCDDLIRAGQNISFGSSVTVNKNEKSTNTMHAVAGNVTVDGAYTFNQNEVGPGDGDVLVQAGTDIIMNGAVTVKRPATALGSTDGQINWTAGHDINTKSTVSFDNQDASGVTQWEAVHDILTDDDVTFTHAGSGETKWLAGNNITSIDCVDDITFTHTGTGDTYWEATNGSIDIKPEVFFSKTNATSTGYTEWKAGANITTRNNVTFEDNNAATGKGTRWLAGTGANGSINVVDDCDPVTIDFHNATGSDGFMEWWAKNNINVQSSNTPKMTVDFTNNAANGTNNYMSWHADQNDIDISRANITFTTNSGSTGYTEWYAGDNILADQSKIDFVNSGTGASNNTLWHANNEDIHATNTPITFTNNGTGWTHWWAGRDILLHAQSPTSFTDGGTTGDLELHAGNDIRTGTNSPTVIDHTGSSSAANITLWAGRNVWTQSSVDVINHGTNNKTLVYAGQDIRIDSTLTYVATTDIDSVKLRANNGDIIINTGASDIVHNDLTSYDAISWCDNHRAAVNFTLNGAGGTEWWARHNIIATDTVHFHYDHSGAQAGSILLHAEEHNIDLRRPFKVDIDAPSLVRLEAINPTRNNKHFGNASITDYNGTQNIYLYSNDLHVTRGSIRTSDSVVINRLYDGSSSAHTEIEAYNDIQTAMFDFTSHNQRGDTTDIISRMGDIWLGYSWANPAQCTFGDPNYPSPVDFDLNRFIYRIPETTEGKLNIKAGYGDTGGDTYGGGNIYFTHVVDSLGKNGNYNTEISIPYSNMFICANNEGLYGADYERAGIISGVSRCQSTVSPLACTDTGLIHIGNMGDLRVSAGTRGNIIFNNGAYLQFQGGTGNALFLTQWGDIDMRHPFNVDSISGDVLFYANSLLSNKTQVDPCSCDEKRNNVYLQDFQYIGHGGSGSIFIGADNNIKLQYGGLYAETPTKQDPFYNRSGYTNDQCGTNFHCDANPNENRARDLILNFDVDTTGVPVTSGGFAAVASDLIDIYKNTVYHGGQGTGMGSVPGYGSLHGENVSGYGLYIKTQANKKNWNMADYMVDHGVNPLVGAACMDDNCGPTSQYSFLHNTARVTFHADARFYTQGQRSLIASPVMETYGHLDLNTHLDAGSKTAIRIQTDSLIMHDSLILDGSKTTFASWSPLRRNMPVFKFGHHRFTPPFREGGIPGSYCKDCYTHLLDPERGGSNTDPLDTIYVTFRNDASVPRLHTMVADHAYLSFLTDSADHISGNPTIHAKFYVDTFKIRNHVELLETDNHTRSGHFELVSEPQMTSKSYAGVFARHLHLEPVGPDCSGFGYSQFWPYFATLDIIPTSTFGGYGWIHSDVHVAIGGNLFPGYASLGRDGNCYEQKAGFLRTNDMRIDKGANLKFSLGENPGFYTEDYSCYEDGEEKVYGLGYNADFLDVDSLTVYGEIELDVTVRSEGLNLEPGESRCFPIIRYQKVQEGVLNHMVLKKDRLTPADHPRIEGTYFMHLEFDTACHVVSLCISTRDVPTIRRTVTIPAVAGVKTSPGPGRHYVDGHNNFNFTAVYTSRLPLMVKTTRFTEPEEVVGHQNENGEYEYTIYQISKDIVLTFGPEFADADMPEDGAAVWSHNESVYIRVNRDDIASIYSIAGQLIRRIEVSEGDTSVPMVHGLYIVTLKDGSVHKVIVK